MHALMLTTGTLCEQFVVLSLLTRACQLCLHSERATFMKHAKHSRCQEVTLVDGSSYDTAWWVDAPSVCVELT